ncbi:cytosine permease [Photobacterium sp.]|uniref:cytosine permease n=1 Tax=Photobacterium sp. TaxID=660 RepID=UPI00299DBAD7|nr:cytosine permease [Photobacterium sp.]MDX1301428.1 cytosine permease [Photobacterium sp.]
MTSEKNDNVFLEPEYELIPVPVDKRKSLPSVAAVWFGFPMVLTSCVIGGVITSMLGFKLGVASILAGNLLLCLIVGTLSWLAGSTGMSFAMTAQRTFGKKGYWIVSGMLSVVVVGWFALMVGLTGDTMFKSFGASLLGMTLLGGILYVAATFIGVKALTALGWIAAPLYLVLGSLGVAFAMDSGNVSWSEIVNYQPGEMASAFSFGAAVTLIFATFADSGTMTADFTRWAKNGREGFLAAFSAFPVGKFLAEVIGAIIVATGVIANPELDGGNFMLVLSGHGPLLTILAIVFIFINLGVGCTHCLYNAAVGFSHMTGKSMRTLTVVLGGIGILVAMTGIWNAFQDWLNLLGLIVPPIATIIIVDQVILHRKLHNNAHLLNWEPRAFISWALASCVALLVNFNAPQYSVVICGIVSAAVFYLAARTLFKFEPLSVEQSAE